MFVKGQHANPFGRPKGSYSIHTQLEKAIKDVEKEEHIEVYKYFVKRALKNDTVLIALLKKLVPDRQRTEGDLQNIINIVYGYRQSIEDIRTDQERNAVPSESRPTESS